MSATIRHFPAPAPQSARPPRSGTYSYVAGRGETVDVDDERVPDTLRSPPVARDTVRTMRTPEHR